MPAPDRKAMQKEILETLNKLDIDSILDTLDNINDDVQESADNMEEHFPTKADELRDSWEGGIEEAKDKAEEIKEAIDELRGLVENLGSG